MQTYGKRVAAKAKARDAEGAAVKEARNVEDEAVREADSVLNRDWKADYGCQQER